MTVAKFYEIKKLLRLKTRLDSKFRIIGYDHEEFMEHIANDTDPEELFLHIYNRSIEDIYHIVLAYKEHLRADMEYTPEFLKNKSLFY